MCIHWNGYKGGNSIRPKQGMKNVWEYDDEEKQVCFQNHFEKKAWNSCGNWEKRK
jgi:hypothetical protein